MARPRRRLRRMAATLVVCTAIALAGVGLAARPPRRAAAIGASAQGSPPGRTAHRVDTPASHPWVGALQAVPSELGALRAAGVTRLDVQLGWNRSEPSPGTFDTSYLRSLRQLVAAYRARGFGVTLDLGLQYPPAWVFGLTGQTRFVDQYGQSWVAAGGQDAADLVWDPAVRAAAAAYIRRVATALGDRSFDAIRVGGLSAGELRYPPWRDGTTVDDLWMYGPAAQAGSPFPGWRPGSGTPSEALACLRYYFASLTGYERWLLAVVAGAFRQGSLEVLFPGWGLRPGAAVAAARSLVSPDDPAVSGGMIAGGEAWPQQVAAMQRWSPRAVVYTTWLDAPAQPAASAHARLAAESPARYLAGLAATHHLEAAGENTGPGSARALRLCVARVRELALAGFMWMSAATIVGTHHVAATVGIRVFFRAIRDLQSTTFPSGV